MAGLIRGVGRVNANIAGHAGAMAMRSRAGMRAAVMIVQRRALHYTPIDTGNLRGSQWTDVITRAGTVTGRVGYGAAYAIYVHEMQKNYRKSGTGWKYLSRALAEEESTVIALLTRYAGGK